MKRFVGFAGRVTVAHVVTYIAVGALAYPLLTREFFEGSAGLAAQVMRTPAEPAPQVFRFMGQILGAH